MSEVLAGAPDEVVTNAILQMVSLSPFGHTGNLALITLDNGADHNRPNTFGAASLASLSNAIDEAQKSDAVAIAVTGKPFIFAAGADLSAMSFLQDKSQAIAIEELLAGWQLISDSNDITVWTGFFCDGKLDWKPKIKFNRRKPQRFMKDIGQRLGRVKMLQRDDLEVYQQMYFVDAYKIEEALKDDDTNKS